MLMAHATKEVKSSFNFKIFKFKLSKPPVTSSYHTGAQSRAYNLSLKICRPSLSSFQWRQNHPMVKLLEN